ncbi:hypothetical protein TWF730_002936 [Orbilia blumenaviensis]|uniref:Uncharacterized protein n=1 Tax=Orbilia blumenaviensis TaxID=1796055 RepID=A0AAV9U8E0_9PEZI
MSIFGAITTFAASSLTTALLESTKQNAPAHEQQQREQQTDGSGHSRPKQSILPQKEVATGPGSRIIDLSPSQPPPPQSIKSKFNTARAAPVGTIIQQQKPRSIRPAIMQPTGLPQNSIWSTMSYPIPRGPCLQKSSLISGCSCQRFMVHPLKATTSFDCDGCGHHASFHKMKSHEEEVENAARFRESLLTVEAAVEDNEIRSSRGSNGNSGNSGRRAIGLLEGRVEDVEEDDDTVDGDSEYLEPDRKKRAAAGKKVAAVPRATGVRGGKRKRVGELVTIE